MDMLLQQVATVQGYFIHFNVPVSESTPESLPWCVILTYHYYGNLYTRYIL